jgi:hypothetical protein
MRATPDKLRQENIKLNQGLRRRSLIGFVAASIVIVAFGLCFFTFPNRVQRLGSVLTVAGTAYLLIQLPMRRAAALLDIAQTGCVRYYRAELERQRDFHKGWWFWSRLMVFAPGPIAFLIGFAHSYPSLAGFIWLELALSVLLGIAVIPLNLRLAGKYQKRIEALDKLEQG